MSRSVRGFLLSFAVLAVPLGILAGAGVAVALRQLAHGREVAMAQTLDAATAMVVDNQETLRREAILLAQDPALIDAAVKGDWATLVRWASPRIRALTRGGVVDLLVVRDARGIPLVQVPALPPPLILNLQVPSEPAVTLRLVNGRAFFLATAPIWDSTAQDEASRLQVGTVVIARRFESLGRALDQVPARPGILLLAGDRALASTRPGAPPDGWSHAVSRGRAVLGAEVFALRLLGPEAPVSPDGSLWALVPETELYAARQRLWIWFVAALAVGAASLAVGVWVVTRGVSGGTASEKDAVGAAPGENARLFAEAKRSAAEYQTLFEVGGLISSTLDVERVLDVIVDRCRAVLGVAAAGIFKLDSQSGMLAYQRGVGFSSEFLRALRVRLGEGTTGRAARDGVPVWSQDLLADPAITLTPETRALVVREGYRAVLSVPILSKGEVHGALAAYWWEPRTPSPSEIALMGALAGQAAIALENARLYGEAARQAERMRAVADLGRTLVSTFEVDRILEMVATQARDTLDISEVGIALQEPETGQLRFVEGPGFPQDFTRAHALEPGEGVAGRALSEGRPVWTSDILADPLISLRAESRRRLEAIGSRAVLALPLIRQRPFGALVVHREAGHRFADPEIEYLTALASQVAVAVENARLHAETNRRLEETQALLEIAEILNSTLDPTRLLKQVAIKIAQVCRVERCSIERWDGDRVIPLMSQFADGRREDHLWAAFIHMPSYPPRDVPAHAQAIETRRPVIIPDATVTDLIPREWIETFGHKSFMAVPLIRQDAVIGLMTLDHTERVTPFQPWQVDLATAIAGQLALSIENARLYAEAQERLRETTSLLAVGQVLSRPAQPADVMRRVAREVAHAFGADMVGVYVLDARKEALAPMAGYHVPKHLLEVFLKRPFVLSRFTPLAEEWARGRAVWSSDVTSDPRFDQGTFEGMGPISVLFAPTPVRGESVGALFLVWWGGGREFQPAEVRLMEGVASQVGLAMENAELARQTLLKLQETENLHELSRAVTGQLDQAGLLETIHQQVARLLDVRHMIILLYDEASQELEVVMRVKDGVRLNGSARRYPRRAAGLSGIVLDTGRPIRTDDYTAECARRRVDPVPESVGLPHWLGVPMAAGDRIMGVLGLRSRDRAFTEGDQRLLASIADLAALALRSARLYEERTRAHSELAAAQDHLVRTEKLRALGEMASGVAHDFNNVLASILGRAQLLLSRVEDGKLSQWIQVIERSAMDGARTVRRLQEFTRIRRDQPVVPVDLNQVVQQTLETTESTWRQEFRSRGIEIDVATTLAIPLPRVSGDPAELREAMTNLILNALDAMPQGGKLSLATSAADGRVEVRVSDTGVGIPTGIRQKIFDPFFTTKGPKGTGLGLSMTYGILARHNARITVESEEAHGTTFRMIFRAAPEHAETAGPPTAAPADPAGSLRCLVVDDERAVAEVLGDMLVSAGHSAAVVGSGQEAVTRFGAEPFDLVLTDLAMPGMTGWDVARAVKDAAPGVRVVLVSGFGVELSPEDLRAHGVDLVLAKPLKIRDIEAAIALIRPAAGAS